MTEPDWKEIARFCLAEMKLTGLEGDLQAFAYHLGMEDQSDVIGRLLLGLPVTLDPGLISALAAAVHGPNGNRGDCDGWFRLFGLDPSVSQTQPQNKQNGSSKAKS